VNSKPVDVLVVGAGPTGLTLAAALAANGIQPRVIDRGQDRVHESRALAIQPRTLEVLAGFGVTDRLVEAGNRAVRMRLHTGRRDVSVPLFDLGLADSAYPYLLFVSQAETERILGEHLARVGVAVERGVEFVGAQAEADMTIATLRHDGGCQESVTARYVVGCDGAHSAVRSAAGIAFEGSSYPQTFVLVDTEVDGITNDAAHVFLSERGMLFFFPLGSPASWRLLAMRPAGDQTPPDAPVSLAEVQQLADAYTSGAVRLHDAIWMTNFRLHHRAAAHYRAGQIFLAGDAAHIHSPAGAQGMNTGIQDAVNLGWKLAHTLRGANEALLDTYETERAPVGRWVLRFTDRAFKAATATSLPIRFVRSRVVPTIMPLVLQLGLGRRYGFRAISQLSISYRRSLLSVDGTAAPRHGPRAGDRLPDAPVRYGAATTSLHSLISAPGWHLLRCGTLAEPMSIDDDVADVLTTHNLGTGGSGADYQLSDTALRRLGLTATDHATYLVRPDGHVGYRSGSSDATELAAYLRRWLPATGDRRGPSIRTR
jgi:2-polyprenyl-6-methoxyphenol hydroxylase-like FAD-dependent oxidoreductase